MVQFFGGRRIYLAEAVTHWRIRGGDPGCEIDPVARE